MENAEIQNIIKRVEKLKGLRSNWESQWQECATYCLPTKTNITTVKTTGTGVDTTNYDSTARNSTQVFAAAMHSYLTNPASKWFSLRTKDKYLMNSKAVKTWFKSAEDTIYNTFNGSNFAQEVHEGYLDLACFGTFALYEEEDEKDIVRFYCRPLREMLISEGADGRVDTAYRCFKYTARQAFQRWGKNSGEAIQKAVDAKDYEKEFDFIHCVQPRHEFEAGKKDAKNMPYASLYVEVSQKHLCEEGGYKEFPFFIPRFSKLAGDVWGYSPAMVSLPDIKMLNAMSKTLIRSAQKIVDPPVEMPHDGYLMPMNFNPGGINFRVQGTSETEIKPILSGGNIPIGLEMVQDLRANIQKAFFVDVFLMLNQDRGQKTATEVNEMASEKMLITGPVLGRLMSEFLNQAVVRTFNICYDRGQFEEIPEELQGKDWVVEYISPLAKAQKFQEMNSLVQFNSYVGQLATVFPTVLDKVDSDKSVDAAADLFAINPEIVYDDKEVAEIREQKAQQMQAQQEMMMAQQIAATAKDGSQAVKNLESQGVSK